MVCCELLLLTWSRACTIRLWLFRLRLAAGLLTTSSLGLFTNVWVTSMWACLFLESCYTLPFLRQEMWKLCSSRCVCVHLLLAQALCYCLSMVSRFAMMVLSGLLNLGNRWLRLVEVRLTCACSPNMLHPLSRRLRTNM